MEFSNHELEIYIHKSISLKAHLIQIESETRSNESIEIWKSIQSRLRVDRSRVSKKIIVIFQWFESLASYF